jgi:hypothetical protein
MSTYNLFLDDFREPSDAFSYTKDTDFLKMKWSVVRSYEEFTGFIAESYELGVLPELISFDHDLADDHYMHLQGNIPYDTLKEKTGYHCAQWLIDFCIEKGMKLPSFKVHSMNPAGKANILSLLQSFSKFQNR